jgi:anthranilate phosphoribosyltransferase
MDNAIKKVVSGKDLNGEEAEDAVKKIMSGATNDVEMASLLTALKNKGETCEEIAAFAKVMREFAVKIEPNVSKTLVDMCGTGGDKSGTYNISTTAMFIVAASGIPVAKHGNAALTSRCGSADVLEALGVNINTDPSMIEKSIEKVGIGFMYAPMHHSAMKHVMPVRKTLGFRTIFNLIGPLTNPANAKAQVMGVYDPDLTERIAEVFRVLGLTRAMVVHGEPGLDELSTAGRTKVSMLKDKKINNYYITPEDYGIERCDLLDLFGGSPQDNAGILRNILSGRECGPKREIALLNAAAGIVVGGKAEDLSGGLKVARKVLDDGSAYKKLEEYIEFNKK